MGSTGELHLHVVRTDNQLVELVLAGDTAAFEQLFDRHKRMVAGLASRYFRRPEEIEELVQTAFAKAYMELEQIQRQIRPLLSQAGWAGSR